MYHVKSTALSPLYINPPLHSFTPTSFQSLHCLSHTGIVNYILPRFRRSPCIVRCRSSILASFQFFFFRLIRLLRLFRFPRLLWGSFMSCLVLAELPRRTPLRSWCTFRRHLWSRNSYFLFYSRPTWHYLRQLFDSYFFVLACPSNFFPSLL